MIDSEKQEIYFHLGLPKTASTYLQRVAFPQLKGIHFHKKHDFNQYKTLSPENGDKHLFSCEMDTGIFDEMDRISQIFPGAYIILVFRSHYSWIVSKYKYSIRKWNHLRVEDYYSTEPGKPLHIPDNYYRSIIEYAERLFPGRVLVLNYHELKQEPGKLERRIMDFMGLDPVEIQNEKLVNKAFSTRQLVHLLKYNNAHRYHESKASRRWLRRIHYRYRQYLLHIVAFFSRFIPANEKGFLNYLEDQKTEIGEIYRSDWSFVLEKAQTSEGNKR